MASNTAYVTALILQAGYLGFGGALFLCLLFVVTRNIHCLKTRIKWERIDFLFSPLHRKFTKRRPNVKPAQMWMEFYIVEWQLPIGAKAIQREKTD